jgi:hypothetical protein
MYSTRCNYCHPGESIRRPSTTDTSYYDYEYQEALKRDFPNHEHPFGLFI